MGRQAEIVLAVDKGAASRAATAVAGLVASALRMRVAVLHVDHAAPAADAPDRRALRELTSLGVRARILVRAGDPVDEIVAASRAPGSEMLVIGSRGRSSLAGIMLGSVSQEVVARAGCPVLVVRSDEAVRPPMTILLAIEGLHGSDRLLDVTARLGGALHARVAVVHVSYPGGEELERALYHARRTHGEQAVAFAVDELRRRGVDASPVTVTARAGVARALARYADSVDADLVVIGSHGAEAAAPAQAELSTAVVHRTRRPVLIAREADLE